MRRVEGHVLTLLERTIQTANERLVLVAPDSVLPSGFRQVICDSWTHRQLIRDMQSLRGAVYLEEGNIQLAHLSSDGLHRTPQDGRSWHLLVLDSGGHVTSCASYLHYTSTPRVGDLKVGTCDLVRLAEWRDLLHDAVGAAITRASTCHIGFAEAGGWAVSAPRRYSPDGLLLALASVSLSRLLGGALGFVTANVKHGASTILRRLGCSYVEWKGCVIPAYFDQTYETNVEILRFDTRYPSATYLPLVERLERRLPDVTVVAPSVAPVLHSERDLVHACRRHRAQVVS